LQDVIGLATHRLLRRKLPVAGELIGRYYMALEARLLRQSNRVVMITEDFRPILRDWGVADERMLTIENWAPLDDLPLVSRERSAWAREVGAVETFNFVYAGTMGMKHNPELILRLAEHFDGRDDVQVLVLSQGKGADWLRERQAERGLPGLRLLPYVPIERMPEVLAAADVLVAVLEPDAGVFSVPSKVLAYLCGGKPVLLAVPPENLIARIIKREEAGRVVGPADLDGFVREAAGLAGDGEARAQAGRNARAYAERTFAIEQIADRFESVFADAVGR
jgi:glycosyltransferase involved in cell wall biosynthesis